MVNFKYRGNFDHGDYYDQDSGKKLIIKDVKEFNKLGILYNYDDFADCFSRLNDISDSLIDNPELRDKVNQVIYKLSRYLVKRILKAQELKSGCIRLYSEATIDHELYRSKYYEFIRIEDNILLELKSKDIIDFDD